MNVNRGIWCAVVAASFAGTALVQACDPPQVIRVTTVAVLSEQDECPQVALLRKLEELRSPVHVRVGKCENELAEAEQAVAAAKCERDQSTERLNQSMARIECGAKLLKSMCGSICIDGTVYSKHDVAAAVRMLLNEYQAEAQVLELSEQTLTERIAIAEAVAAKVANWKRQEKEILKHVALLTAEHNLQAAQAANSTVRQESSRIAQAEKLVAEINSMLLPSQLADETSTVDQSVSKPVVPDQAEQDDKLLEEVDQILEAQPASVSVQ